MLISRRQFLAGLAATLAVGCGNTGTDYASNPVASTRAFDDLAARLRGQLLYPESVGFSALAQPYNLRFASQLPAAIANCASVDDIAQCVAWVQSHASPFVVRSGGHSYAGFSVTNGLLVDVAGMNSVSLDPATGLVTLGAGVDNGDVYAALANTGRAIPQGRCPGVGVAGLVLGGGVGFAMREHGLTCDHLVETDVLTADGVLRTCNESQNSDLFWACRGGGGGNFGVNTRFVFRTYPVDRVTAFQFNWTVDQPGVFAALLPLLAAAPTRLGAKVTLQLAQGQPITVNLLGQLFGTAAEVESLFRSLPTPTTRYVQELPYYAAQEYLADVEPPQFFKERSRYFFDPLSPEAQATIFHYLNRWPGTSAGGDWKFFLQGGQVAAVAPEATAYFHRRPLGLSSIEVDWSTVDSPEVVARNLAWQNEFHEAMAPLTSRQSYQNFIDESQADYLRAYYGTNLERLVEVKRRYDPTNVFHYPQSIPVSLPAGGLPADSSARSLRPLQPTA